jgi:hypothetical protein
MVMAVEAVVIMRPSMATRVQVPGSGAGAASRYRCPVTTPQTLIRRAAVTAGTFVAVSVALSGPAMAEVPEGWAPDTDMSWGHLLVLILAIPVGLAIVITLLASLPGLVKGEGFTGGHAGGQWIGGPRRGTSELAQPDDENSQAGGASARW